MRRDPAQLASTPYDLVVVGGGIHGLMAAYDAASRGLGVALVERGDFGGGLSCNHQRTIHGGLRDVGAGRLGKARRQIRERRTWARIAPHLLRPLPFLVGTYGAGRRSRMAIRIGFALYDRLGRRRNEDVTPELHLPAARLESAAATRRLFAGIEATGLTGGAVWYDYQTIHPDRINWLVALAADAAGARLANYVEATDVVRDNGRVTAVRVRDRVAGVEHEIRAAAVLVAAGSALAPLLDRFGAGGAPPLVRAMNLLLDREGRDIALVAPGPSGRMLTLVPWRGRLLVGTAQSAEVVAPDAPPPGPDAVQAVIDDVNRAFPALGVTAGDVLLVHHGLVPATVGREGADLIGEPVFTAHASSGRPGLYSLAGVKYTTARLAAEAAVDVICRDLQRPVRPCGTANTPLPHAAIADVEGRLTEALRAAGTTLEPDVFAHLASWYGTEAPAVVAFSADRGLLDRLAPGTPVLAGEIAYAAAHGSAVHLDDVVLRRTALGSAGHPGRPAVERAAAIMSTAAGWHADDFWREIAGVDALYPPGAAERAGGAPGPRG